MPYIEANIILAMDGRVNLNSRLKLKWSEGCIGFVICIYLLEPVFTSICARLFGKFCRRLR